MGKVFQNKICDICGIKGKVIETWGKKYCKSCWDAKPKKGKGHSGMVGMQQLYVQNELPFNNNLYLEKNNKRQQNLCNFIFSSLSGFKRYCG